MGAELFRDKVARMGLTSEVGLKAVLIVFVADFVAIRGARRQVAMGRSYRWIYATRGRVLWKVVPWRDGMIEIGAGSLERVFEDSVIPAVAKSSKEKLCSCYRVEEEWLNICLEVWRVVVVGLQRFSRWWNTCGQTAWWPNKVDFLGFCVWIMSDRTI